MWNPIGGFKYQKVTQTLKEMEWKSSGDFAVSEYSNCSIKNDFF